METTTGERVFVQLLSVGAHSYTGYGFYKEGEEGKVFVKDGKGRVDTGGGTIETFFINDKANGPYRWTRAYDGGRLEGDCKDDRRIGVWFYFFHGDPVHEFVYDDSGNQIDGAELKGHEKYSTKIMEHHKKMEKLNSQK